MVQDSELFIELCGLKSDELDLDLASELELELGLDLAGEDSDELVSDSELLLTWQSADTCESTLILHLTA